MKEIGRPLKPGLVELVGLRNQVAREMGYKSYFALKVAEHLGLAVVAGVVSVRLPSKTPGPCPSTKPL